jgi:hypothetical protein
MRHDKTLEITATWDERGRHEPTETEWRKGLAVEKTCWRARAIAPIQHL